MKLVYIAGLALGLMGCSVQSSDSEPGDSSGSSTSGTGGSGGATSASSSSTGGGCGEDITPPNEELPGATDPTGGVFTLDQALEGLPQGPGPLRAIIDTTKGELTCELHSSEAPNGVANFAGLARGQRPWQDGTKWVKRPFYDGLTFHRVIAGFVVQGGDPLGTGFGGPGYKFADEISSLLHLPGTLAYANSGPNTNGSQFYIAEVALPNLDGGYTVFGSCEPISVVLALTGVATGAGAKPIEPLLMNSIKITRCAP